MRTPNPTPEGVQPLILMKLNNLYQISPLEAALKRRMGGQYLARRRLKIPPIPQSGFQWGHEGARLNPRQKRYFGGSLTSANTDRI